MSGFDAAGTIMFAAMLLAGGCPAPPAHPQAPPATIFRDHACGPELDAALEAALRPHESGSREALALQTSTCTQFDRWSQADPAVRSATTHVDEVLRGGCHLSGAAPSVDAWLVYPGCMRLE